MQNVCGSAILSPTDSLALILCVLLYYYHTSAKKEDMCNSVTWNAKGGEVEGGGGCAKQNVILCCL